MPAPFRVKDSGPLMRPEKVLVPASVSVKVAAAPLSVTMPVATFGTDRDLRIEASQIEGTATDRQGRGRGQGIGDAVLQDASGDGGGPGVGADRAQRQRSCSRLGERPGPGDVAAGDVQLLP